MSKPLTKGDNNAEDGTTLYAEGQGYLSPEDIVGGVLGYVPVIEYVAILLSEYSWLKTAMLGLTGLADISRRG